MTVPLCDLPPGTRATVESIDSSRPGLVRFRELGLLPGTPIKLLRTAPLGDPVQVEVGGSRFSIRKQEARAILVDPSPSPAAGS